MSTISTLRMLTRYSAWANQKLFAAVAALPAGVPEAPPKEKGRGFGSMVYNLNHSYAVDLIWRAHMEGTRHGFTSRNTETMPALAELTVAQARLDAWFIGYADNLSEAAADEMIHFNFVDGGPGSMTRSDMLLHVVNHKTYHRGFVAEMIYQVPAKSPSIDLPVYLRDGAAAAPPAPPAQLAA
jgi:uncharacterized damage-inducible protein DinB